MSWLKSTLIYRVLVVMYYNDFFQNLRKILPESIARAIAALLYPFWLLFHPRLAHCLIHRKSVIFEHVDIPVTTNCTLKCKHCGHLMSYYKHQPYIALEQMLSDIDKILDNVDFIVEVGIIGGEPFLYPHLKEVLERLIKSRKILNIGVTSNGTLIPCEDVLKVLRNKKLKVQISDYGEHSRKKEEWRKVKDIHISFRDQDFYWQDMGQLKRRSCSDVELLEQHQRCWNFGNRCFSYFKGKLFRCPRAGHGWDLGVIALVGGEYVEVRENNNKEKIREGLRNMRQLHSVEACNYCYAYTELAVTIPAGEQAERVLDIPKQD